MKNNNELANFKLINILLIFNCIKIYLNKFKLYLTIFVSS